MRQDCKKYHRVQKFSRCLQLAGCFSDMPGYACAFIHGATLRSMLFPRYVELWDNKTALFQNLGK